MATHLRPPEPGRLAAGEDLVRHLFVDFRLACLREDLDQPPRPCMLTPTHFRARVPLCQAGPVASTRARIMMDNLEDPVLMSASAGLAGGAAALFSAGPAINFNLTNAPNKAANAATSTIVPLTISSVNVVNGGLVASGVLGNTPFTAPITLADPSCPILNLHLGPFDLNLLELKVDTSQICLSITAHRGGGLLGRPVVRCFARWPWAMRC